MDRCDTAADVCVIGGGVAGLTTACYLARAGIAVTLFEKAPALGGRAATQHRSGFAVNRGIHALYAGGAASHVFRELGVAYTYGSPTDVQLLQHGQFSPFPAGLLTLLRSRLLGVRDKLELARVLAGVPRLDAHALASTSVEDWLTTARRPLVRRFLAGLAHPLVYTSALDLVSAEVLIDKLQRALTHPVQYIDGGWQTLVDALRGIAERAGATIVCGCGVERIVHAAGTVQGVQLRDGSVVRAAAVVIATTPREANKLVDGGRHEPLRAAVERLVPVQVACLDVALERLPEPRRGVVHDLDQPRFLSTQSLYADVAPAGGAVVSVFKQLDPRIHTDARTDQAELEALLDAVQPGWRTAVVERQYLPRIEAVGALPLARSGGFRGRPGHTVPGIRTCYLAGDWVGPEGFLVDASLASARVVAQRLITQRPQLAALLEAPA